MVEIRFKVHVTERDTQRICVVRNPHELAYRRLLRAAEIEPTHIGVVIYVVPQHGLRSPVQDVAVVSVIAAGLVVGVGRIGAHTRLRAKFVFLIDEVGTDSLIDIAVDNLTGIHIIKYFPIRIIDEI